jgi:hypothetical protein
MANCYLCDTKLSWRTGTGVDRKMCYTENRIPPENMSEDDKMCGKCYEKLDSLHNPGLKAAMEKDLKDSEDNPILPTDNSNSSTVETTPVNPETTIPSIPTNNKIEKTTTSAELTRLTESRHNQTKAQWNKNGIIQFKDEAIAILERRWGSQVQFIVACSQVTKEGYRLMAIDEGKEGSSGGFSGGVNAYFYFQKMDYVR